jgi:uncharacterized linocin/CFP29 family protein
MTTNNPQVPWTDEQWARVNQVVQEEASRARVAATFLPLIGPLPGDADFVRKEAIYYPAAVFQVQGGPPYQVSIDDRNIRQLATLQIKVRVRGAQMADPEMASVLAMFRRAANVLARLEDTVVFRGLVADPTQPVGPNIPVIVPAEVPGLGPVIWQITGGEPLPGLLDAAAGQPVVMPARTGDQLVIAVSDAIGALDDSGHFGPFALVLGNDLFVLAQTPATGLVLPQDRIIPFLGGGSLLRSSTLPPDQGVVVALGGTPVELIVATDVCFEFLQLTLEPAFLFRVCEKMVLRVKEPAAIVRLTAPKQALRQERP